MPEDLALYKSKRPFCNAFTGEFRNLIANNQINIFLLTGCGRKRSDPEMSPSFGGGGEVDPEAEAQILAKRLASDMENWDRFQNRMQVRKLMNEKKLAELIRPINIFSQGIRRGNDGQRRFGFFPSFI